MPRRVRAAPRRRRICTLARKARARKHIPHHHCTSVQLSVQAGRYYLVNSTNYESDSRRMPGLRRVLRPRRRRAVAVQAAFFLGAVLPPPAAFALVLAGKDRARARLAADRYEAALVQRVVGDVVLADVGPRAGRAPVGERI